MNTLVLTALAWCCLSTALSSATAPIHAATVSSCHNKSRPLMVLPNPDGVIEYSKASTNEATLRRIIVTKDGRVYSLHPLMDLVGVRWDVDVRSLNTQTGQSLSHKLVLRVAPDARQRTCGKVTEWRHRRAVSEVTTEVTVDETVKEVNVDYSSAGVRDSPDNRFYLVSQHPSLPFTHADLETGRLIVSLSTPMDYESAPNHRYTLLVYINSTDSSDEYRVAVSINLLDVNDEVPIFTMQPLPYLATADPDLPANSKLDYRITVSDGDANSLITYALLEGVSKFRITQDGQLFTTDRLSAGVTYTLRVKVTDANAVANTQTAEASISVLAGQRPPQFYQLFYEASTPENVQGTELSVLIKAKSFQGDAMSFTMSQSQIFMIVNSADRPNEARVRITTKLDYETDRRSYNLEITATERGTGLSNTAQLIVTLKDVNDNSPIFDLTQYVARDVFREDVPLRTPIITVRAVDADSISTDNGRITYSVQSVDGSSLPFMVETRRDSLGYNGTIIVSRTLDYDGTDGSGYTFLVIATDHGQPSRNSTAYVRVQVQNTNDEAPRFGSSRVERIEATKEVNSVITTVFASDPDGDKVTYAIVSTDPAQSPFRIVPDSGSIKLTADLTASRYEETSSFKLNVSATDDGSCCPQDSRQTNTGYTVVVIEIVGRNHAPEFRSCSSYNEQAKVPENTNNAFVVRVQAQDEDVGPNGEIKYSIVANGANVFRIGERNGEVYTKVASIDREATSQLTITVKAEDGAISKLSTFCTFTVNVLDINDNMPSFNLPPSQVVGINLEPNSTIYNVFAVDPDHAENGTTGLRFAVTGNDNFWMDGYTLKNRVQLGTVLSSTQLMNIVVTDGGGLSTSKSFTVSIQQTAAPPRFTQFPSDDFSILENVTDDEIIARIKAESATGGPVNYYLVPATALDAFYMRTDDETCNANNELCLAIYQSQNVDADQLRFYKLRVRVTPQTSNSVVAEKTINVEIKDVNDNIPVFENTDDNGYVIGSVDENTTVINTQVVALKANDSDITPLYKTKTYSLEQEGDHRFFRVDPDTGIVRVGMDVKFDRENKTDYIIYVKATDGAPSARPQAGGKPNSGMTAVLVKVNDINDNPPNFPQNQYIGQVEETAAKGELVMNVRANDKDIDNNFQYIFVRGNDNQAFELTDAGDLLVFDSGRLDYETKKLYNMEVEVTDGRFQASTNVQITLVDMNDNVPIFSQRVYTVTDVVEEDNSISPSNRLPIVKVSATDADVDRPNNIQYALSGSYSDRFQVDPQSGQVYLVRPLDRDSQPQWDVNILAYDEPGTPTNRIGYAIISVFPKDINDNYPMFNEDSLTAILLENGTAGEKVEVISAVDKDAGNNGSVKFRMLNSSITPKTYPLTHSLPYFTVDENGVVKTLAKFDREKVDRYTFSVVAYDEGSPSKSTTATATIIISDKNDNPPKFEPDLYQRQVSELAGPLTYIVQVNVEDIDSEALFSYSLDTEALKNFSIDTAGIIYIREQQKLDFEHFYDQDAPPVINITVTVNDGKYSATATVRITVVDENDETPIFEPDTVPKTIKENVPINTLVHTFTATDRDADITPRNSEIEYLIDRSSSSDSDRYFKVNPTTGQVTTQKTLDRETLETHTVKVLAVDNGFPTRRTGTATLIVSLEDVNDNGPRLLQPRVYIDENFPLNSRTRPEMIKAVDDDDNNIGNGPPFRMSPTNGSEESRDFTFTFHPDWDIPPGLSVANGAGELRSKRVFDREGGQGKEINFYLQLVDKQDLAATRLLTVVVADEDDNPPFPGRREALVYNYKDWQRDYDVVEVGDCYAEDRDDWDKPYKNYEQVGTWPDGFSINGESGMISADLRVVPSGVHDFKCKVIDNYIADTACAYACNVAGGSDSQTKACKDRCREKAEAISDLSVTIKTIGAAAVWNGASIRLGGTAERFLQAGADGESPYTVFIKRLAKSLNTGEANIDVFSVLDSSEEGFVDVRFTAHGSPYYNTTKLIGAVLDDPQLGTALGMYVAQVPVNECLKEVCAGGCTNALTVSDEPTLVNANGSSLLGVTAKVGARCSCGRDNGSQPQVCTPHSCLHGGVCTFNRDSQTTSCDCPPFFDGPRCQQLRHSFTGSGWAEYKTLTQCGNSSTSLQFITSQSDGLLLYNGPTTSPGTGVDSLTDFILIAVSNSKPLLYIDFGTGPLQLTINTVVDNGVWHKLQVTVVNRRVTLTLDDCEEALVPDADTSDTSTTRSRCQHSGTTPGENQFLNLATLLELGGRSGGDNSWWPENVPSNVRRPYDGCVRSLEHNGELYDLHVGNVGRHSSSDDECPRVDAACHDSNGSPYCGENGVCQGYLDGRYSCLCSPGWRGDDCTIATGYMDFSKGSFVEWELLTQCVDNSQCRKESYRTDIQISFRSRDPDNSGLLFYVPGENGEEYLKLMITGGRVQLRYDIGSDSIDILRREQTVLLPVVVTDGDLHTLTVTRVGKKFTMQIDGGEGRRKVEHEDISSHQLFLADGSFYSGADGPYMAAGTNITSSTDLENTCVTDVRYNGKWFPSNVAEAADTADVRLVRRWNVADQCQSDACANVNCPAPQLCTDLWRDFECICPGGYITVAAEPYCEDINECFPDTPCVHGTCTNLPGSFRCDCDVDQSTGKLYTGPFCNTAQSVSRLKLSASGIAALFVSLLIVLVIALGIFCYITRRSNSHKGETLIESYDDVRETIYNYDEEGMPEEDQEGYDITRLSKPISDTVRPVNDKPLGRPALIDQPPDVGDFINGRLNDADGDPTNCPGDELNGYMYEGNGSSAGSLSSLGSSSSGGDQNFDYLNDWGPKFGRLADMYGEEDEL